MTRETKPEEFDPPCPTHGRIPCKCIIPRKETKPERFTVESLRKDIAKVYGEFGAHIDIFDRILSRLEKAEERIEELETKLLLCARHFEEYDNPAMAKFIYEAFPDLQKELLSHKEAK